MEYLENSVRPDESWILKKVDFPAFTVIHLLTGTTTTNVPTERNGQPYSPAPPGLVPTETGSHTACSQRTAQREVWRGTCWAGRTAPPGQLTVLPQDT